MTPPKPLSEKEGMCYMRRTEHQRSTSERLSSPKRHSRPLDPVGTSAQFVARLRIKANDSRAPSFRRMRSTGQQAGVLLGERLSVVLGRLD